MALLTGAAGTGKTTLLRALLEQIPEDRMVRLLAPTGRAARVLSDHTGREAATIHRHIYNLDRIVENAGSSKTSPGFQAGAKGDLRFEFRSGVNPDPDDTLYIVDEASMIADREQKSDLLAFGSGRLLADFLAYVEPESTERQILFVGDPYQLPPVGENLSPALSPTYLTETFDLEPAVVELSEVVRQEAGSQIIAHASQLRRQLDTRRFESLSFEEGADVQTIYRSELTEHYADEVRQGGYDTVIAITYTNRAALRYNQELRARRFGPPNGEIQSGDRVIVVHNNYLHTLFNGELGEVTAVGPVVREIGPPHNPLRFRRLELAVDLPAATTAQAGGRDGDPIETLALEDLLYSPKGGIDREHYKLLWDDARKRLNARISEEIEKAEIPEALVAFLAKPDAKEHQRAVEDALQTLAERLGLATNALPSPASLVRARNRRTKSPLRAPLGRIEQAAFRQLLRSDPYYNALRLKFGYAVTCHKAQGGEWDAAFVDIPAFSRMDDATLCRWTYTAVTRAARRLYVLS